ncbi:MAG TPA: hypothetical protein VJB59_04330 [Bdellovibrionota bacterium]|nr:hypothetical protein [Bdellovibrionota bacterium]
MLRLSLPALLVLLFSPLALASIAETELTVQRCPAVLEEATEVSPEINHEIAPELSAESQGTGSPLSNENSEQGTTTERAEDSESFPVLTL